MPFKPPETIYLTVPPPVEAVNQNYWNHQTVRNLERKSIREFVERSQGYLTGRVLDYGAGKPGTCAKPQPYRDLVTGEYSPFDEGDRWPVGPFDTILCTQVLQYLQNPAVLIGWFRQWLNPGGHVVISYATCWDEVEEKDLWRITKAGMHRMLTREGFAIVSHERRAEIDLGGFKFPLGYGVVARLAEGVPTSS